MVARTNDQAEGSIVTQKTTTRFIVWDFQQVPVRAELPTSNPETLNTQFEQQRYNSNKYILANNKHKYLTRVKEYNNKKFITIAEEHIFQNKLNV